MGDLRPKGEVIFFNKKVPVTWERETFRYVYDVKRMKRVDGEWKTHRRNFDDKMDKTEIYNGEFKEEYIPKKERKKNAS